MDILIVHVLHLNKRSLGSLDICLSKNCLQYPCIHAGVHLHRRNEVCVAVLYFCDGSSSTLMQLVRCTFECERVRHHIVRRMGLSFCADFFPRMYTCVVFHFVCQTL